MRYFWKVVNFPIRLVHIVSYLDICPRFSLLNIFFLFWKNFQPAVQMMQIILPRYNFTRKTDTAYLKPLATLPQNYVLIYCQRNAAFPRFNKDNRIVKYIWHKKTQMQKRKQYANTIEESIKQNNKDKKNTDRNIKTLLET